MLTDPCDALSGVGPTLSKKLAKCGIHTIQDLLFHLPYRYQDRTRITPIQDVRLHDCCVIEGNIANIELKRGRKSSLLCHIEDKTGLLTARFFHFNKAQIQRLAPNQRIRAFGEIRKFSNHFEMIHPQYQLLDDTKTYEVEETLTPVYSTTQGLTQTRLRQLIKQAFEITQEETARLEWMQASELQLYPFESISNALACLHAPPPDTSLIALEEGRHPALARLAFDELLAQRLSLQFVKQHRSTLKAPVLNVNRPLAKCFIDALPFTLTSAQKRAIEDIRQDLATSSPMLRLVQGDVGSGKTVIAAIAALQAIASGYQVAFMAPTDLLSEQHAQTFSSWLSPLNLSVQRLSGTMKATERKKVLNALANHDCHMVIGTHALFQSKVTFNNLGLIIIDEQHRFGVEQRLSLQQKGENQQNKSPHQLLMTATPIPRTLAMTQLAHMDVSILDELPPGRTPIITAIMNQDKREHIITRLKEVLSTGRQAYWVCTLIEDSEKIQCMAATETANTLQSQLPEMRIGLIHGRMKTEEKESVMDSFKQGNVHLLVATTVIEVGVDVPEASLMIIENAERLGLSQLHQLRGRVGRGNKQAHCLLLYQAPLSQLAQARLKIMRETTDGFLIAEQDLQLRGAGEFLGTRQTGYQQYKIADLKRDHRLLPLVSKAAQKLLEHTPEKARLISQRWLGAFENFSSG